MKSAEQSQISQKFPIDLTTCGYRDAVEAAHVSCPEVRFDTYRLGVPNQQLWRGSQTLHLTPKVEEVEEVCEALVRRGQFLRAHGVDAAREVLAPVYGWFTEGLDTADLQEANALLEELW